MSIAQDAEIAGTIDYTRQRDWLDPTTLDPATARVQMVGVGGIGTPTALLLAKLGVPRIDLIDFDEVERHNLPNQLFPLDSTGESKTDAMGEVIEKFAVTDLHKYSARIAEGGFEGDGDENGNLPRLGGIVIAALDSMEARKNLWEQVRLNTRVKLFLDARLGGENIVIHAIDPLDKEQIDKYEETLYTDDDAREDPCTRRSVIDVGFAVAALLGRSVRKHLAGEKLHWRVFLNQDNLNIYKED